MATSGIVCDIVTRKRLNKLRQDLDALRQRSRSLKPADLMRVAKALGRTRDTSRGKEPTFVRPGSKWFPLSIPDHPGTIPPGTAKNILSVLDSDLEARFEELDDAGAKE